MKLISYDNVMSYYKSQIENISKNNPDEYERQYAIVSASLVNYLPEVLTDDHEDIFKEILLNQRLTYFDQSQEFKMSNIEFLGFSYDDLLCLKKYPQIICTYHYGSYRLINHLLALTGIPFALIVSSEVIKKQGDLINTLYAKFKTTNSSFNVIDAESRTSAIQMLRALTSGKSLVVYIDGNTGAGDSTFESNNCIEIPFLENQIKARKGVATLSYISKTPIIPFVCIRKSVQAHIFQFGVSIKPTDFSCKDYYVQFATSKLFSFIGSYIVKNPGQWESLLYLHKFFVSKQVDDSYIQGEVSSEKEEFKFNSRDFGLFTQNGKYVLLKKKNYITYVLNYDVYKILRRSQTNSISDHNLKDTIFNKLITSGVLINE
jgi:lauroyl/myristoyl acyltransferase